MDRGLEGAREALTQVGHYVQDLRAVEGILKPNDEATGEEREDNASRCGRSGRQALTPCTSSLPR